MVRCERWRGLVPTKIFSIVPLLKANLQYITFDDDVYNEVATFKYGKKASNGSFVI